MISGKDSFEGKPKKKKKNVVGVTVSIVAQKQIGYDMGTDVDYYFCINA